MKEPMILILFLLTFSVCAEQKPKKKSRNCEIPQRPIFPKPVFNGVENLSFEGCGFWDESKGAGPPWRVVVQGREDGQDWCQGNLISPTAFITVGCKSFAEAFARDQEKNGWKALVGKCYDSRWELDTFGFPFNETCANTSRGQILQLFSVTKLDIPSKSGIYLWKTAKATLLPNWVWPVCLFNKDNQQDFQPGQNYTSFDLTMSRANAELVAETGSCLPTGIFIADCSHLLCVRLPNTEMMRYGYLLQRGTTRFFLRGVVSFRGKDDHLIFTDLLPFLDKIVLESNDLVMMPKIPTPQNKTDFGGKVLSFPKCGEKKIRRRRREDVPYIYEGVNVRRGELPWHAALIMDYEVKCGGTLVSRTAVLTAAHCVFKEGRLRHPSEFLVVLGSSNLYNDTKSEGKSQKIQPSGVLPHPDYTSKIGSDHDVALLLFNEPGFNVSSIVRPICLWNEDYDFSIIAGKAGEVAGWGNTEEHEQPDVLKKVTLRVEPYLDCYLKRPSYFTKRLKPGINFCAGVNNSRACVGDSGGGFILERGTNRWFLRGVVSYGDAYRVVNKWGEKTQACSTDIPSFYVDLASNMDWIVRNVDFSP